MDIKRGFVLAIVLVFFPVCALGDEDRSTVVLLRQMYLESAFSLVSIQKTQEKIEEKISEYERLEWESYSKNRFSHNMVNVLNALLFLKTQREKMKALKVGAEHYYYLAFISSVFCKSNSDCGFSLEETELVSKDLNDLRIVRREIARIGALMAVN